MPAMLEAYPCAHQVETTPVPWEELNATSWCCCVNLSWIVNPAHFLGCRSSSSGLVTLCIGICFVGTCVETYANTCKILPPSEIDTCCLMHCVGFCCSISECQQKGIQAVLSKTACGCVYCFLFKCDSDGVLKVPTTCQKGFFQLLCAECRMALPCDEDVPFACGCCGVYIREPDHFPEGTNWKFGALPE